MPQLCRPLRLPARRTVMKTALIESSVNAPIPVVGAPAGVDVELLADAIDLPLQIAVLQLRDRIDPPALQEHVADQQTEEVRRVGDAPGVGQRRQQSDTAEDRHAYPSRNPEH